MNRSQKLEAPKFASQKARHPTSDPQLPASPTSDIEGQAVLARARRVATCEREIFAAITPILERHRCRLGTVQEVIDGQAGPVRVVVFAKD